jgi:hypothetical protein
MESLEQTFKTETKTIKFLLKAFFFFIHLAVMTEIIASPKFRVALRLVFFLYLSTPYYKTIKHRFYTYWTFSALLFLYILYKVNQQFFVEHHTHIGILYLLSLFILMLKMYILSSPIYYPRVSWWEYDFRYRDDLRIKVKSGDHEYDARLTDLRRYAGCVGLFEDLKLGDEIIVTAKIDDVIMNLRGQVMSKRRYLIGRPLIYGVLFKFDSRGNKKRYIQLVQMWKKEKNNKRKLKFAHV